MSRRSSSKRESTSSSSISSSSSSSGSRHPYRIRKKNWHAYGLKGYKKVKSHWVYCLKDYSWDQLDTSSWDHLTSHIMGPGAKYDLVYLYRVGGQNSGFMGIVQMAKGQKIEEKKIFQDPLHNRCSGPILRKILFSSPVKLNQLPSAREEWGYKSAASFRSNCIKGDVLFHQVDPYYAPVILKTLLDYGVVETAEERRLKIEEQKLPISRRKKALSEPEVANRYTEETDSSEEESENESDYDETKYRIEEETEKDKSGENNGEETDDETDDEDRIKIWIPANPMEGLRTDQSEKQDQKQNQDQDQNSDSESDSDDSSSLNKPPINRKDAFSGGSSSSTEGIKYYIPIILDPHEDMTYPEEPLEMKKLILKGLRDGSFDVTNNNEIDLYPHLQGAYYSVSDYDYYEAIDAYHCCAPLYWMNEKVPAVHVFNLEDDDVYDGCLLLTLATT